VVTGENGYFGKKLIVSNGVYVVTDRLGSVRANTQGESFAYYPYGEERTNRVDGREKFATYFRDAVGQDYAGQRYYSSGTGQFFTADPMGLAGAKSDDPVSWNRYGYAGGDPINRFDPSGSYWCYADGDDDPSTCKMAGFGVMSGYSSVYVPNPEGGGYTTDGGGTVMAGSGAATSGPCDTTNTLNAQAISWITLHGQDATAAATNIQSTEAIILGLSAVESGWGGGDFVTGKYNNGVPINNFFSQHAPAPGENGTVTINGNYMATYASYAASAAGFDQSSSGALITGVTDPTKAISALQNAGLYGINRDGSKVAGFVSSVVDTINFIANRIGCVK
jgi:RHS repeat-associated protein